MAYVMGRNVGDFELIAKWYPLTYSKPQCVDFGSCSNFQLKTLSAHCVYYSEFDLFRICGFCAPQNDGPLNN